MNKKAFIIFGMLFLYYLVLPARVCLAVSPYDNWALPEGWLFSAYPTYYSAYEFKGNNGDTAVANLGARASQAVLRATYYDKTLLPKTLGFTAYVPVGRTDLRGDRDTGIGDLSLAAGYWLIDDHASRTYFVAGAYVDLPTGDFDKSKAANMGKNVYKIRPAIGWAKQLGRLDVELSLFYNIYGENKDTGVTAGSEMIFESYAGYYVLPGVMLGGNFNFTYGEDRESNGKKAPGTGIRRFQAGPSLFWRAGSTCSVTVSALTEFGVRNSSEGNLLTARLTWRL